MTEPKTPGQIAYEKFWDNRDGLPGLVPDAKKRWERAAESVRAPLLQRIAELEAWLDKPNKVGWWSVTRTDGNHRGVKYETRRVDPEDLIGTSLSDAYFKQYRWRFIGE